MQLKMPKRREHKDKIYIKNIRKKNYLGSKTGFESENIIPDLQHYS
jgi:hypothetical protein